MRGERADESRLPCLCARALSHLFRLTPRSAKTLSSPAKDGGRRPPMLVQQRHRKGHPVADTPNVVTLSSETRPDTVQVATTQTIELSRVTTRKKHDLLGERDVPAHAYWGVHSMRPVENFP